MIKMNAGAWIGIIAGIFGMAVALTVVLMIGGSVGFYIAAGLIVLFGGMGLLFYKLFFKQMILAARLRKVGVPGKAIITDIQGTNVAINYNPQVKLYLDVKNSLGQTYKAFVLTVVNRFQPNVYQVGMAVPVLIDPNDENKLILDDTNSTAQPQYKPAINKNTLPSTNVDYVAMQATMLQDQRQGDNIRLTGKTARAIIKKNTWLGIYINGNNPYTELQLEVLPNDAPAFEATVKVAIAEQSVPKYQPGQEVQVKYDGVNVAIEHS